MHHWLPILVEDRRNGGTLVPWVQLPEVGGGEGALVACRGQGVEPGEGDDGGEGGGGLWGRWARTLSCCNKLCEGNNLISKKYNVGTIQMYNDISVEMLLLTRASPKSG